MTVSTIIRYGLVSALIISAIVLTGLRMLLPQLSSYQAEIEQRVTAAVGQPVRFERLSARMVGLHPELTLDQVSILSADGGNSILQFDQLVLRVSLLGSLVRWQLSPALIRISGAQLSVARQGDQINVVGLIGSERPDSQNSDELLDWLLQQQRLELADTRIHYRDLDRGIELDFSAAIFQIISRRGGLRLSGRLSFTGAAAGNLELVGVLQASEVSELYAHSPWNLYLNIENLRRDKLLPGDLQAGGSLQLQGWMIGNGLAVSHVDGDIDWTQPLVARGDESPIIDGQSLRSSFAWNAMSGGWRARLKTLEFKSKQDDWQGQQLIVSSVESALRIDGGGVDLAVKVAKRSAHLRAACGSGPSLDNITASPMAASCKVEGCKAA